MLNSNYLIETNEALHFKRWEWSGREGKQQLDLTFERSHSRLKRGVRGAELWRTESKKPSQTPCPVGCHWLLPRRPRTPTSQDHTGYTGLQLPKGASQQEATPELPRTGLSSYPTTSVPPQGLQVLDLAHASGNRVSDLYASVSTKLRPP